MQLGDILLRGADNIATQLILEGKSVPMDNATACFFGEHSSVFLNETKPSINWPKSWKYVFQRITCSAT